MFNRGWARPLHPSHRRHSRELHLGALRELIYNRLPPPAQPARINGPSRRAHPPHAIHLRPADGPGLADRAPPPGAAQPHADPLLLAQHHARGPLHQLAAGPVRQLPGAAGLPGKDARIQGGGRSGRGHGHDQPVRLFRGRVCGRLAVQIRCASCKRSWRPISRPPSRGRFCATISQSLKIEAKTSIDFIWALNQQLQHDIGYLIRMEPGVQTPEETLKKRSGSCRDLGWLLVHILRHYGLAARFVSGYLIQLKADMKSLDGPSGTEHDFTDLHAWAEVYLPGAGWIGLDPTSGLFAGEGHIPLAATPSPQSAAPVTGMHDEAEVAFSHEMQVTRILESPRVTLPYTEEQWQAIAKAGHEVDRRLREGDVRLSMGGEPTFVSIDDVDGAEWNTEAVGPDKRRYAETLIRRLRDRFAPGGLLHYGQGKWYPGEQLPRWSFSVYWRRDEQPLWENDALVDHGGAGKARHRCRCRALHHNAGPAARSSFGLRGACLRRSGALPAHRAEAAAQSRSAGQQARRSAGARPRRQGVRARPRQAVGLRDADPGLAQPGARPALGDGALGVAARQAVPHARRLAGGLPAADRLDALYRARELSACYAHRSVPGPQAPAAARGAAARPAEIGDAPAAGRGACRSGRGLRHGAHGDGHRAARRPSLRVHAAA